MKRHKKHIKNESNWWEWIKDEVRICTPGRFDSVYKTGRCCTELRNIHETLGTAESAQSALYLADFPTDESNPNGEISKLLPYRTIYAGACGTIRCILYTRHLPQIVGLTRTVGLILILGRSLRIIKCSSF